MSGKKTDNVYHCTGCGKVIPTIDKILWNMRCQKCAFEEEGVYEPWERVEARGKERMRK